jgi:hypothetical protein
MVIPAARGLPSALFPFFSSSLSFSPYSCPPPAAVGEFVHTTQQMIDFPGI